MRHDERELLEPWRDAFAKCFGGPPEFSPFEVKNAPPGEPLFRLSYPSLESTAVVGHTGHFAQSSELSAHVAAFGYAWDGEGCIRTAPTPSTFNVLLPCLAGQDSGFPLEFQVEDTMTVSLGAWLLRYMRGVIPVHFCTPSFYAAADPRSPMLGWQLTTLVHDLTVHALNYHLVPRKCALALGERIREALPERAKSWAEPGAQAPLTLSYFYDNDLNRFSYEIWSACTRPPEFARVFEDHMPELVRALDVRIEETRAGKGDVPSGNTRDMAPLTPTEFAVRRPGGPSRPRERG